MISPFLWVKVPEKIWSLKMRRIVKNIFGERTRTKKRDPYFNAGFKSYENVFEEERLCRCTRRDRKRKAVKENTAKRAGLFE